MAEMEGHPEAQDNARIVMLIDDEPAQSRLVTAIVARDGWRTIVAPDAETAIAVLGDGGTRRSGDEG
jgi:DNA-binding NtrC family response regulator